MRVDLAIRFKWYEIREGQLLDPERGLTDPALRMLFTYPARDDAYAAMSQYVDAGRWHGRTFALVEVFGLE